MAQLSTNEKSSTLIFISFYTYHEFYKRFNSKNGHIFSNFQGFKVALNFLYDPNCTLKTNGWIYSCFEPVFIEKEGNICFQDKTSNSNSYVLCQKALSRSGCFVDYLNAKSNFLNALNLMASSDRGNLLRGIEDCLGVAPSVVGFPRDRTSCNNPGQNVPSFCSSAKKSFLALLSFCPGTRAATKNPGKVKNYQIKKRKKSSLLHFFPFFPDCQNSVLARLVAKYQNPVSACSI